jgi:transcriptional regulator with XRE-family HTH domain
MAQRIEALRTEKGLSRPALATALGLPRMSIEKFETGRQTPSADQQKKLASFFGVSLFYLKGENDDRTDMENWLNMSFKDEDHAPAPVVRKAAPVSQPSVVAQSSGGKEDGAVFSALLKSASFQNMVRSTVLEVLRSPEGQELIAKAVRKELRK